MSSANFYDTNSRIATGAIIAIAVGSVVGLVILIATIVGIVCIIRHSNRSRNGASRGMTLQPSQPNQYPQVWPNQYQTNSVGITNYPLTYPAGTVPYTASTMNYAKPTVM
ncbi:unnamed protein product [Adineta steineri]|uniref:Uncharacterized protein n=1 Tax=Adineta steineri TaxID=433720 RepID=A0A815G5A0_9BILA|nr:unnamed protein product [Adineta steineri]CAF3765999.1 unnamed protein product [Adineta steineri]